MVKKTTTSRGKASSALAEVKVVDVASDVRKPVETIAVNPRSGKLTLLTRKLFNVLLYHAQEQGVDEQVYSLPLSEICSTAQFDSNDTSLIKEHLRKMNSTQVEWSSTTASERQWDIANLIASATIREGRGSKATIVEWSYAPNVKASLLRPEVYTRISLQFQSALRSSAALALFEICTRYSTNPSGVTMRERWEWWRPRLTGIPEGEDDSAAEYKYFKRDVLKPALSEVNQVTDLAVDLIEHKNGRRIEEIQFRVSRKKQTPLPLFDKNLFDMDLLERVMSLGIHQIEAEDIYANTEEGLLRATLILTEKRMKAAGTEALASPAAYFKQGLKKRWAARPDDEGKQSALIEDQADKQRRSREALDAKYAEQRRAEAKAYFDELDEDTQSLIADRFGEDGLVDESKQVISGWKRSGLKSNLAAVCFFNWLANDLWGKPTEADLLNFLLNQGATS